MRYLVFSDIHSNLEAFQALLEYAARLKIDGYLFLGDLVGYNVSPDASIELIQTLKPLRLIRGNHDKAVCGLDELSSFNPIAASAITWTRQNIKEDNLKYLQSLEQGPREIEGEDITICHGAPFDEDYYLFGEFDAAEAFLHYNTSICFFGHTHFPCLYARKNWNVEGTFPGGGKKEIRLKENTSYLINPGSVGQPRDRNPKASCAVYDSEVRSITFHRFKYDIKKTQEKILKANLPIPLAERLKLGI